MNKQEMSMRIGIDIGGTFTDFVVLDSDTGEIVTFKLLPTPKNPAKAMLGGLEKIPSEEKRKIIHGSAVATNALLKRNKNYRANTVLIWKLEILQVFVRLGEAGMGKNTENKYNNILFRLRQEMAHITITENNN